MTPQNDESEHQTMRLASNRRTASPPGFAHPVPFGLSLAAAAALLAACQSGHLTTAPRPSPTTTAISTPVAGGGATTTTTAAAAGGATTTTTAAPPPSQTSTTTTVTVVATSPPTTAALFATVTGTYYGSTASSGWLYIRSDGASRYRYADVDACKCSTATAPIATVDFSLTTLVATGGGGGHYQATGRITAESDPTTGMPFAGSIGSAVTAMIGPPGSVTLSFLSPKLILRLPPA